MHFTKQSIPALIIHHAALFLVEVIGAYALSDALNTLLGKQVGSILFDFIPRLALEYHAVHLVHARLLLKRWHTAMLAAVHLSIPVNDGPNALQHPPFVVICILLNPLIHPLSQRPDVGIPQRRHGLVGIESACSLPALL